MTEPCSSCLYCFCPRRTGNTWSKRTAASCCQNRSMGSRLFVESPTSMTLFASCICRPLFERCTHQFLGNIPKSGGRCRISRLRHDQRARRCPSQLAKSSRSVIGARLCLRARRREQDWPGAVRRGMTEQWSREPARKRNKTARTAREQVGSGKSRMGRVADQVPARGVAPPLQFTREHQTRELRLSVGLPWRVHPCALQIIEIDEPGTVRQAAEADDSRSACPAQQWQ